MGKHSEWRKLAKKLRRKRIRQCVARERDDDIKKAQQDPRYQEWLKFEENNEKFLLQEAKRIHDEQEAKWLETEKIAQRQWKELQLKIVEIRKERDRQNARIKEEWEQEKKRMKDLEESKKKEIEEKARQQEQLKNQIDSFIANGGQIPDQLNVIFESNPGKTTCPFFSKTSTCRFGDLCSRNHVRPGISKKILIPNFYIHYSLTQTENEHGSCSLEFENSEIQDHFKDFFFDVVPEMEKCGRIKKFVVCCNGEAHLRGNVYVEYKSEREAVRSYKLFNGRWYAGKQLNVEFCGINSWSSAICGLFYNQKCPKGSSCNFIHSFQNPKRMYNGYNDRFERSPSKHRHQSDRTARRDWRWSESPEHEKVGHYIDWEDRTETCSKDFHPDRTSHVKNKHHYHSDRQSGSYRSSRRTRSPRKRERFHSHSSHRSQKKRKKSV
ncbi:hypothetical protein WA026_009848 [Henosepilachna vigintioctopunctata]|uniref:Uncharacterized protein n=1 Tax=Henosepilachna vigintioctopunctata TaxID=420089 RepID=A0AAW1TRD5_9CUCU